MKYELCWKWGFLILIEFSRLFFGYLLMLYYLMMFSGFLWLGVDHNVQTLVNKNNVNQYNNRINEIWTLLKMQVYS